MQIPSLFHQTLINPTIYLSWPLPLPSLLIFIIIIILPLAPLFNDRQLLRLGAEHIGDLAHFVLVRLGQHLLVEPVWVLDSGNWVI